MSNQNYNEYPPQATELILEEPVIYAGFWQRFGAAFIDGLIIMIPNWVLQFMLPGGLGFVLSIVLAWLYSAIQESSPTGATIGKKAMGLRVTTLDGGQITFGQATGRHFGKMVSAIILLFGYLMMLWDDRGQTLHDKMANTLVVGA